MARLKEPSVVLRRQALGTHGSFVPFAALEVFRKLSFVGRRFGLVEALTSIHRKHPDAMLLKDFPLAWRWTDEKYALLPQDVLSRIEPHSSALADKLFQQSLAFHGSDGLSERTFSLKRIETKGGGPERVTDWLLACHEEEETRVHLSWQPNTAVSTTWGIFARYWDAFCYPASDDLDVWSEANNWVLLYHHEEFIQFGERRGG